MVYPEQLFSQGSKANENNQFNACNDAAEPGPARVEDGWGEVTGGGDWEAPAVEQASLDEWASRLSAGDWVAPTPSGWVVVKPGPGKL